MYVHIVDFVADKFTEGDEIRVYGPGAGSTVSNIGKDHEISFSSYKGTLKSITFKYYFIKNWNSRCFFHGMSTNSNMFAYTNKPSTYRNSNSRRAFPIVTYV